jgi:HEAT repeat protein
MADDTQRGGRISDVLSSRGLAGKRDYVRSLEQRRDAEALSLLVECLCDESWYLRELAEAALLTLGERSGPALVPLLGQGLWFSRASAARVLGQLGYRPAAGPLVRLSLDRAETVAREAFLALAALALRGGAARLAWEVYRLAPERRPDWMARMRATDRVVAQRLERLLTIEALMSQADPDVLRDDAPLVRANEEGVEWDLPSGPPPVRPSSAAPESVEVSQR